jgi:multimeric flavodoxin WrbA
MLRKETHMKALFINGSPNRSGSTAALAAALLAEKVCETVQLPEIHVGPYGSHFADDAFPAVLQKMKEADVLVVGSPVYWHNICGPIRTLLDRFYGPVDNGELAGKKLVFLFQGEAPEKWMLEAGEYTIKRWARLYKLEYLGMAVTKADARKLASRL